jgi:hypothetical protein
MEQISILSSAFEACLDRVLTGPGPGPWDADWEAHPYPTEVRDLGDGYRGVISRATPTLVWNVYVIVPDGHPMPNVHSLDGLEVTFHEGRIYGIDHAHGPDLQPMGIRMPGAVYTTAEMAWAEAERMKAALSAHSTPC